MRDIFCYLVFQYFILFVKKERVKDVTFPTGFWINNRVVFQITKSVANPTFFWELLSISLFFGGMA